MPNQHTRPRVNRELFVRYMVANGQNAAEAWVAAGGSEKGAKQSAHRLLQDPEVAASLARLLKRKLEQADITAERVMLELGRRAFSDIRECFDHKGRLVPIADLSADAAAAIDGIEVDVIEGKGGKVKAKTVRIRRSGKDAALGMLARHFKIVGDIDETIGKAMAFAERLGRARERVRTMRKT